MEFPHVRLLVFTKAPVAGQVMTRLLSALSADDAARLHLALLAETLARAVGSSLAPVELWVADDPDHEAILGLARHHGVPIRRQEGRDLGARMQHAADYVFAAGCLPVIVGTDCPEMNAAYLREACAWLSGDADVVLGPAEDGGYVLIGLAVSAPEVFHAIPWGTSGVMGRTRERIGECGLSSHELGTLWDLDRPADLARVDLARLLGSIQPF